MFPLQDFQSCQGAVSSRPPPHPPKDLDGSQCPCQVPPSQHKKEPVSFAKQACFIEVAFEARSRETWILKMYGSIFRSIGGPLEKLPVSDEPIRPKWRTGRSLLVRQDCLFCQSSVVPQQCTWFRDFGLAASAAVVYGVVQRPYVQIG